MSDRAKGTLRSSQQNVAFSSCAAELSKENTGSNVSLSVPLSLKQRALKRFMHTSSGMLSATALSEASLIPSSFPTMPHKMKIQHFSNISLDSPATAESDPRAAPHPPNTTPATQNQDPTLLRVDFVQRSHETSQRQAGSKPDPSRDRPGPVPIRKATFAIMRTHNLSKERRFRAESNAQKLIQMHRIPRLPHKMKIQHFSNISLDSPATAESDPRAAPHPPNTTPATQNQDPTLLQHQEDVFVRGCICERMDL